LCCVADPNALIPFVAVVLSLGALGFLVVMDGMQGGVVEGVSYDYTTGVNDSRAIVVRVNELRAEAGVPVVEFSPELYSMAVDRAEDMVKYNYATHTNPYTRACAQRDRDRFGFGNVSVSESVFADPSGSSPEAGWRQGRWEDVLDYWMFREEKENLMFPGHTHAAVACRYDKCVFLATNDQGYARACT
jgi:uncharacterized protein YkwD